MGKYDGKTCRIVTMLSLTVTFLLVEIIVGHMANSLALIADAFHMLSDALALTVGLLSVKFAKKGRSKRNTYGWARAEVVGAMFNAVFLVALSFTIFVEAIERLAMRESIDDAYLLLYVGSAGLAINLIGLLLFHNHAHGHTHGGLSHSHGHSHGSHGHSHGEDSKPHSPCAIKTEAKCDSKISDQVSSSSSESDNETESILAVDKLSPDVATRPKTTDKGKNHQLNMRGVFIHVLGDALGSVVVMISATVTILARKYLNTCHEDHTDVLRSGNTTTSLALNATEDCAYTDPEWVQCIDPILSLVLVAIILCTAVPLLKQTALVLMQSVPSHIAVDELEDHIRNMRGVEDIHEFHVWSLAGNKVIASLILHTTTADEYIRLCREIKSYLHEEGVNSVTIQAEFIRVKANGRQCVLECGADHRCHAETEKLPLPSRGALTVRNSEHVV